MTEAERKPSPAYWITGKAWTCGLQALGGGVSKWRRRFAAERLTKILPFQPMMPGTPERRTQSLRKHP